jgi:hypothetical protein
MSSRYLKGSLGRRAAPGASCKHPPFATYHQRRAALLIWLVVSWNRGQGRIVDHRLKVHRSVRTRVLARVVDGEGRVYVPAVRYKIKHGPEEPQCLNRDEWSNVEPTHFQWVN